MANLKAGCVTWGEGFSGRKETSRLGTKDSLAYAQTWKTFASIRMQADGGGVLEVKRGDRTYMVVFSSEDEPLSVQTVSNFDGGQDGERRDS